MTPGRRYLDFLAGIAVNSLGHAHPVFVDAIAKQAATLAHVSNYFATEPQLELAARLKRLAGTGEGGRVYFGNSGAEANEAAFKLARLHGGTERPRILALTDAFHGRTMGTLALTGKPYMQEPFLPMTPGVEFIDSTIEALEAALDDRVAALFVEPIKGEAGVVELPEGYLAAARALTEQHGALLIIDEIQTGAGRTGEWFAFQHAGITPDAITVAKGIGGGFPIGALITYGHASELFYPGTHGSTFGGNALGTAVASAVLAEIERADLVANAAARGAQLRTAIAGIESPLVSGCRGQGLLIGVGAAASGRQGHRRGGPGARPHHQRPERRDPASGSGTHDRRRRDRRVRPAVRRGTQHRRARAAARRRLGGSRVTRHLLRDDDLTQAEQSEILELALEVKKDRWKLKALEGPQTVAVIFDKSSTRTRVSFAVGIADLGGVPLIISTANSQLGGKETPADTARVLERQVAAIVWRTYAQAGLEEMARGTRVPVVNALSDDFHPCQLLADLLTIREHMGELKGLTLAFFGDGRSNMAHSYILACVTAGMHVRVASPEAYAPRDDVVADADRRAAETGGSVTLYTDANEAAAGADVIVTDTWVSMGKEEEKLARLRDLGEYKVTQDLMALAAPEAIFIHCLPADRGYEVDAEVIDGPRSVVWDEAENRLHAQKALLVWLLRQD